MSLLKINLIVIAVVIIGASVMFVVMLGLPQEPLYREKTETMNSSPSTVLDVENAPTIPLQLGEGTFMAMLADTPSTRTQGLSGTSFLPPGRVLLFVFDVPALWSMWMKDMKYPLDIIWLNDQKEVVHLEEEVQPDTFPMQFGPLVPARYVIEVNAGVVAASGIGLGSQGEW